MRILLAWLALFALLSAGGCGTMISFVEPEPWGGVQMDWVVLEHTQHPLGYLAVLDLPFSFVLDTVSLPVTLPLWLARDDGPP